MKLKIKNFLSNLMLTLKVNFGALILLVAALVAMASVATGLFVGLDSSVCGWVFAISAIIVALYAMRWFYKDTVKKSASVLANKQAKKAESDRKAAEKASIKAQNREAYKRRIDEKYK